MTLKSIDVLAAKIIFRCAINANEIDFLFGQTVGDSVQHNFVVSEHNEFDLFRNDSLNVAAAGG